MCGIAGFIDFGAPGPENFGKTLQGMADRIAHRGPDDAGYYTDRVAALGHRRLSIVDLAGGHQPMTNEGRDLWIVYNGEIFNHASVRPELEAKGHRYQSRCDTETILHGYEEWGAACLDRFRGMFSFAIWDSGAQTLFCARDRLGIKPFYYFWDGKLFAFASEIKALLAHPGISAALAESQLPEYLTFGYCASDQTLFRGIHKLMPGHHLTLRAAGSGPVIKRYWDLPAPGAAVSRSEAEWVAECRRRLEETVQMRLMSDVPLGVFLSGGVDSSAIAALMTRMMKPDPVRSFSVGYAEAEYSELSYARQVANAIGTHHREVQIGMDEFFNELPKLVWNEDEPITWPSSVSLYFVARLAAEDVKVVLTGEGSDELFAGYERYQHFQFNYNAMRAYGLAPEFLRRPVRNWIAGSEWLSASARRKLSHTFLGRENSVESLQLDNFYGAFSSAELGGLLRNQGGGPAAAYASYMSYWNADRPGSLLSRMLYADQKTYLVELLMKQDQMSMATSIESRVPFLDHTFVEFAASVPDHLKIHGGTGKYIMKKAVEDLLPHEIVYRPKMGFPTPLRQWFLGERAQPLYDLLRDPDGLLAEYLDRGALESLIARQQNQVEDATDRLWRLLNLQIWGDIFLKSNSRRHELLLQPANV